MITTRSMLEPKPEWRAGRIPGSLIPLSRPAALGLLLLVAAGGTGLAAAIHPALAEPDRAQVDVIQSTRSGWVLSRSGRILPAAASSHDARPLLAPRTASSTELRLVLGLAAFELGLLSLLFIGKRHGRRI